MHGKALINEALNKPSSSPVPYTGSQIANLKGYTAQEMFRDADKLYECCIEAESQYSPDGMTPMFDLQVEAEILGCDLAWYDNTPPTVCSHPLEGELVIPTRRIQKTDGRIPLILDVMRRFKAAKPDIAMYGLVCGPFTLASHLRGTNIFMDMYDDEDGVKAPSPTVRKSSVRLRTTTSRPGATSLPWTRLSLRSPRTCSKPS